MAYRPDLDRWKGMRSDEIITEVLGQSFVCPACGRTHRADTRILDIGPDLFATIGDRIATLGLTGRPLVVFDDNTFAACGEKLLAGLERYNPETFIFHMDGLHADSFAIGRVMLAMVSNPGFLISCGSGCITDTVRYASLRTGVPFVSVGTAASVDGYASTSTPVIVDGFKITYTGVAPLAIFADTDVLMDAPAKMSAAGYGDVMAKFVALLDWKIARDVEGEEYCPLIALMIEKALDECLPLTDDLSAHKPEAYGRLMGALALTGVAMQLMGNSRPASGGEHHISHLLEISDIQKGRHGSLHGDKVGIGTLITMYMYLRLFSNGMPEQRPTLDAVSWEKEIRRVYGKLADNAIAINECVPPSGAEWDAQKRNIEQAMDSYGYKTVDLFRKLLPEIKERILSVGGPVRPDQLGYTVSEAYDAIAFGKEVRPKFTILRIAERFGWLYDLAGEIAAGLPEGKIY